MEQNKTKVETGGSFSKSQGSKKNVKFFVTNRNTIRNKKWSLKRSKFRKKKLYIVKIQIFFELYKKNEIVPVRTNSLHV